MSFGGDVKPLVLKNPLAFISLRSLRFLINWVIPGKQKQQQQQPKGRQITLKPVMLSHSISACDEITQPLPLCICTLEAIQC